jgi:hypothetical protein
VRSVIRFLNAKNILAVEIHRQLLEVYGEVVMNEGDVRKWCRLFNGEGQILTHVCRHPGFDDTVNVHVRENRRFTIDELHQVFPYVSPSVLYKIVTVRL